MHQIENFRYIHVFFLRCYSPLSTVLHNLFHRRLPQSVSLRATSQRQFPRMCKNSPKDVTQLTMWAAPTYLIYVHASLTYIIYLPYHTLHIPSTSRQAESAGILKFLYLRNHYVYTKANPLVNLHAIGSCPYGTNNTNFIVLCTISLQNFLPRQ